MEKIYFEYQKESNAVEASSKTIQFLTDFSRSLCIVTHKKLQFEINLN